MPPSSRQTPSTNRANEIDSISNTNSNFNSNQNVASRSSQPRHRASSTSTSTSNSPVPTQVSTPPPQHGYYSPSHSYSHSHIHQQSHTHPGVHGMNMGMMQSTSVSPTGVPMSVGSIPGAPFYYHPYSLYPPHTHTPSHGHHGPPPPHPPAPPAPPRANRNNSNGNTSTPTSGSPYPGTGNADRTIQDETTHSRPNTTSASYSTSSNSSRALQSAFPTSDMSRPQLVPTFSYYRNQTDYDKQHHGFTGASQHEGRGKGKGKQNASASHAHNASVDVDHAEFEDGGNDEEGGDDDDDNTNDNDHDMGEYDEPMPMDAVGLGMGLDLDSALVPASSVMPSSSSDPNTLFRGTEKKSNHEYYPSPHHQAHFRELMMTDPSTPLSDPPISLNSLVDSEPGKKPAYPLPTIIRCAILGSPRQQLTLSELYLAMQRRFSYYTIGDGKSWRNSVRHNLSLNNLFQKVTRPITEPGKGCYWVVAHDKPPGNKRERKRNKKLGKRALAAMEREKATAAAAAGGMSEGDGGEDDDNSGGVERSTLPSSLSHRGRPAPTPITAPFPPYPQTSAVASTTVLPSTTMTRPLFPFSRGTVAPNEGSYAAVTGVVPMPSQVPLPPNFGANMGARGYSTNTQFGVNTTSSGTTTGGPFSAFATNAAGTTAFGSTFGGASAGFEHSLNAGNANLPTTRGATHRASSNFANNASKGKGKSGPRNGRVIPIPITEGGGNGGKGGETMSQRSSSQNQDSGATNPTQTGSSQELGSAFGMGGMTPTQATSIQTSQSQGPGRVSTPSAAFSPSLSSSSLPSTTFLQQPLSAQSSFSSTGFSVTESVGSESHSGGINNRESQQNQGFGPHRMSRQNPARRFDHGGSGSTASSTSIANPPLPFAPNRPRDTFNTLAAQIAPEFQSSSNPNDNPLAGVETRTDVGSTLRSRTAPGSRPVAQPPRKKRATLRRDSGSEDGSESERSEEDDDDGDEYVPSRSGPGRRSGRRR